MWPVLLSCYSKRAPIQFQIVPFQKHVKRAKRNAWAPTFKTALKERKQKTPCLLCYGVRESFTSIAKEGGGVNVSLLQALERNSWEKASSETSSSALLQGKPCTKKERLP